MLLSSLMWLDAASLCLLGTAGLEFRRSTSDERLWETLVVQKLGYCRETVRLFCLASSVDDAASQLTWRQLWDAYIMARSLPVMDIGSGYSKYGLAAQETPSFLQLCSSSTHPAQCPRHTQVRFMLTMMTTRRVEKLLEVLDFKTPTTMLVGVPFSMTREQREWEEHFLHQQLPTGADAVVVPQPLLALIAHGAPVNGITVNLGQRETIVVPCLKGRICREGIVANNVDFGGAQMTSIMFQRLGMADGNLLTWCRDLKERHCMVSPVPLRGSPRDVVNQLCLLAPPVEVQNGDVRLLLGPERFLVPEVLFSERCNLPSLIVEAASKAIRTMALEDRATVCSELLSSVVLVGGTAELPGLRDRVALEVEELVRDPHFMAAHHLDKEPVVKVLSPIGCGAQTAVFRGAQLAAVAACALGRISRKTVTSSPTEPNRGRCLCPAHHLLMVRTSLLVLLLASLGSATIRMCSAAVRALS